MYDLIRRVHLYTAMSLLVFIGMYFISGWVMIHRDLTGDQEPVEQKTRIAFDLPVGIGPMDLSGYLQDKLDIPGQRKDPTPFEDGRIRYIYFRPGENYRVIISASRDSALIVHRTEGARRTLTGMHGLRGYGGGWVYDIWVALMDLSSLSMILFAGTGIYLWYTLKPERTLGWMTLATGFGYSAAIILFLTYAR
jgi:hypothetical protein